MWRVAELEGPAVWQVWPTLMPADHEPRRDQLDAKVQRRKSGSQNLSQAPQESELARDWKLGKLRRLRLEQVECWLVSKALITRCNLRLANPSTHLLVQI